MRRVRFRFSINLILRIFLAVAFALTAFVFSDVLQGFPPFNRTFLRIAVSIWFGLLGYGVFPDLASRISIAVIHLSNELIDRVSAEITTRMMRVGRLGHPAPSASLSMPMAGAVSLSSPLILDTSAIIDGRIVDVASTGFIYGTILIPNFVLTELQQVADSGDYLKRGRGRKGFERVEQLKKMKGIRVEIWESEIHAREVDDKLIKLARSVHGKIVTVDFNLNKVATLSGAQVLNINDLANALKTVAIPGEEMKVKIVHVGKDEKQGVGYLNDGTMIVVEDGAPSLGKETRIQVTRMLQSSAGRMIFGKTK